MIKNRAFVSFDEPCAYNCRHCYTYSILRDRYRTIDEIVDSICDKEFDVVYVSQKTDNFADPHKGLELCEKLVDKYSCNLFIITRSVFDENSLIRLVKLKRRLSEMRKRVFIAVSINALESYDISENSMFVPSPQQRIDFIKKLSKEGLSPILMLRPVFPNAIIPVNECLSIIEQTKNYISCVVSSGLGVNDDVIKRLGIQESSLAFNENQEYLQGAIECEIKFIDVNKELEQIEKKCNDVGCTFFTHSIPALNYLLRKEEVLPHR